MLRKYTVAFHALEVKVTTQGTQEIFMSSRWSRQGRGLLSDS